MKWGGVKEARYWSTQYDLQRKEESWKMAHQLHIQGYEDKKRWAQELVEENKAVLAKKAKTKAAQRANARKNERKRIRTNVLNIKKSTSSYEAFVKIIQKSIYIIFSICHTYHMMCFKILYICI